jgi:hypothetical protein
MTNLELLAKISAKSGDHKLLWADMPKQGLLFTTQDFFLLPFSMFGCGFGYFFITMLDFMTVPIFVVWIGWVILLLSIYFFLIRFVIDSSVRAKTVYAFGTENYYILVGEKLTIGKIPEAKKIKCDANVDKSGSIWFEEQTTVQLLLGNSLNGLPFYKHPAAFLFIPDAKAVCALILGTGKK